MKKLIVFFSLALIMSSGNAQSKFKGAWCGQELSGKSSELYTKCLLQNPEIFIPDYPNHKLVAYTIELLGEDIKVIIDRKVSIITFISSPLSIKLLQRLEMSRNPSR